MGEYKGSITDSMYVGDDIIIEELPTGCVIHQKKTNKLELSGTAIVSSREDALQLIESLGRMVLSLTVSEGDEQ